MVEIFIKTEHVQTVRLSIEDRDFKGLLEEASKGRLTYIDSTERRERPVPSSLESFFKLRPEDRRRCVNAMPIKVGGDGVTLFTEEDTERVSITEVRGSEDYERPIHVQETVFRTPRLATKEDEK